MFLVAEVSCNCCLISLALEASSYIWPFQIVFPREQLVQSPGSFAQESTTRASTTPAVIDRVATIMPFMRPADFVAWNILVFLVYLVCFWMVRFFWFLQTSSD